MNIIDSIILGIVEGITEFLPISSTAHMILVSTLLGLQQTLQNIAFEIIIQLGATFAIVLIYLDKINFKEIELWKKVLLAFLPLMIIGFLLRHQVKEFFNLKIVALMFIIGGIVFFIVEKLYKEKEALKEIEKISYKQALIIGIFQVFALIPGTSRSGATIVGGMLSGLSRKTAADFSFLLAIPTMITVSGYEFTKNFSSFKDQNLIILATGFFVSFISCYIAVKWFLKFVKKYTLIPFGIYRIAMGIFILYLISKGVITP